MQKYFFIVQVQSGEYNIDRDALKCLSIGDTMRQRIKFSDDRVCKSHLLDSCPHDILSGTVSITHSLTRAHVLHLIRL